MSTPAVAQQSNASLRGDITTDEGVTVTSVTAIEVDTNYRRPATVTEDGGYNLPSLRPGEYRLEIVTSAGPRTTDAFTLNVAQSSQLDFDFSTGGIDAGAAASGGDIVVTAARIRQMEGGEVGVTIPQRLIEQLPQNNRNFLAFADLAPGVQLITGTNGNVAIRGGAQNSRTVNVFIDGVGQKDYVLKNGITGQDSSQGNPFPQLAIGEYRVISSNYKAEFDQVSSVAITAVTKSGTNEFEGDFFVDYTDQNLRARTPTEVADGDEKTETRDFQFGGALGGPIVKDLLHFFASYEGKRQQIPVDIFPAETDNTQNIPAEYLGSFGRFNRVFNEDLYFGKLSFSPSARDLFELSVKVRKETGEGIGSGSTLREAATDTKNDEVRGLFRYERTGETWVNDFKLTYEDASWAPTPVNFANAYVFQAANGGQIFRSGAGSNYQDKGQTGYSVQNDFTYTGIENHTIKAGVKAKWVKLNALTLNAFNPVYSFNTEFNPNGGNFNTEIPWRLVFGYDDGVGDPIVESENFQFGLYIQDDWDVTDRLTLNLGIRWDMDRTPAYLDFVTPQDSIDLVSPENYPNLNDADYDITDYFSTGNERKTFMGAFQPRIGFSYVVDEARTTTIFGGYGRSYDRNQFDFLQQEISIGSFASRTIYFDTGDDEHPCPSGNNVCLPWDPIYLTQEGRDQIAADLGTSGRGLRFITNDLKVPYSDQFSLGVRRRFGSNFEAEVGYTHIESRDGFAYLLGNRLPNGDFFAPGTIWGAPFTAGAVPGGGNITLGTNGLETSSDSAYVKLTKTYTPSSPWSLNATYTFTEAEENRVYGEYFSFDYPSLADYPVLPATGSVRHRFVAAGTVDLPFGFTFSSKLELSSPPFLYGIKGDSNADNRPVVAEGLNKNPFIIGDLWAKRQIDVALTKYVPMDFFKDGARIRLRVDVLNVLNEENFTTYNSNPDDTTRPANSPSVYREISGLSIGGNPTRTFKFSAGFSF
ncbi:TonB-dependent receptor [Sphingomonas gilva]|nr:TonB-dependent receptor [Sphingomonas gilva]